MVVIGFGSILMAATANTTIQLAVPDQLRGRVMAVYTTVFSASVPIGGLAMGAVASGFGAPLAIAIGGVLSVAVGLAALASGRQRWLRHSRDAARSGSATVSPACRARDRASPTARPPGAGTRARRPLTRPHRSGRVALPLRHAPWSPAGTAAIA